MKLSPILLSIIVPFYNNEDFIVASLSSLFVQIDDDIEVVIINDGSTDMSSELVQQFLAQQRHPHIHFIYQENMGIAQARNVGLQNSTGRYVTFLDGDDILSGGYLAILRPLLLTDRDDLIDFNYQRFTGEPPKSESNGEIRYSAYDFKGVGLVSLKPLFARSMWHVWSRVYRRSLLAGDVFATGRRYEDVIFTPFQYFKTCKIAHINHVLYFYRDNTQGITRNIKVKDIDDMLFAMEKMLRFIHEHQGDEALRKLAALVIANCFSEVKKMSKKIYGYYYYQPAALAQFRLAAKVCVNSDVPLQSIYQMRYPWLYTCLSRLRLWLKGH